MSKTVFDLEKFSTGKVVYHCPTEALAKDFLAYAMGQGLHWGNGLALTGNNHWSEYEEKTCYGNVGFSSLNPADEVLYARKGFYEGCEGVEILLWNSQVVETSATSKKKGTSGMQKVKWFDVDSFVMGEIAVNCPTEELADDFLAFCERIGITWNSGTDATEENYWKDNEEETCYVGRTSDWSGRSMISFGSIKYNRRVGKTIVVWNDTVIETRLLAVKTKKGDK